MPKLPRNALKNWAAAACLAGSLPALAQTLPPPENVVTLSALSLIHI